MLPLILQWIWWWCCIFFYCTAAATATVFMVKRPKVFGLPVCLVVVENKQTLVLVCILLLLW